MPDLSPGYHAKLILNPGDVVRLSTRGVATVEAAYGAPAGTTQLNAETRDFGPYQVSAKLIFRAVAGQATYGGAAVRTPGGGGVVTLPAGVAIALDVPERKLYLPLTVTGLTTIDITGSAAGAEADMVVIANGTHVPTIAGADAWLNNFGFVNTAGARNLLSTWHDGDGRRFAWSQLENITGSPPAPAPDTTAPVYGTPSIANASPAKIVVPVTEVVGLSSTLTGSVTVSVAGSGRTVSSAAVVGSTVEVTLASSAANGDVVTLSAPAGWVRDTAGNQAAALVAAVVTNNVAPVGGGGEDALTTDYRARMAAKSLAVNEAHVASADTFAKAIRAAGLASGKLLIVNLGMNDTLAATLPPFVGTVDATTFNTVTFDPAQGWTTNGASAVLTNYQAVAGNWGMGAYLRTSQTVDTTARGLMGTGTAADSYRIIGNRTPGLGSTGAANGHVSNLHGTLVGYAGVTSGGLAAGQWTSVRRDTSTTELFFNGASANLSTGTPVTTAASVPSAAPVAVMGVNGSPANNPTTFLAANSRVAAYWIVDGTWTAADEAALGTAMQAFQTAMGRQV